jgi:hypothetical protein
MIVAVIIRHFLLVIVFVPLLAASIVDGKSAGAHHILTNTIKDGFVLFQAHFSRRYHLLDIPSSLFRWFSVSLSLCMISHITSQLSLLSRLWLSCRSCHAPSDSTSDVFFRFIQCVLFCSLISCAFHKLSDFPAPPGPMSTWPSSLKKEWTDSSFKYALQQIQGVQLQTELCFELLPDVEILTVASKGKISLDFLSDVRLIVRV